MKELNINNSKKLIIGISILFCTIIVIIGATTAFFTQSDTKDIGNIVTTDINGTLLFDDNNDYMFGNFIPVEENDVISFASKTTDKCKCQDEMYACNLYEFTITNDSNVTQELTFTLDVKENEFSNLFYNLIESSVNNLNISINPISSKVHIDGTGEKQMLNNIVLGPKEHKTYTIIYYVKNLSNIDQTGMDANKKFYANVRIDSIATGTYSKTSVGTLMEAKDCYGYELIEDTPENREQYGDLLDELMGTYKLTTFKGFDENDEPKAQCDISKEGVYYSVNVPSKLKDEEGNEITVSTLGNNLFVGMDIDSFNFTNVSKIEHISIDEGIKVIEDGYESTGGTFAAIGVGEGFDWLENFEFTIELPNSLIHLGAYSFWMNQIYTLNIPASVETIANNVMGDTKTLKFLTNLNFEGSTDGKSNLISIGDEAFNNIYI